MAQADLLGRVLASVTSAFGHAESSTTTMPPITINVRDAIVNDPEDVADHGADETTEQHLAMPAAELRPHLASAHAIPKALLNDATHPEMKQYHLPFHPSVVKTAVTSEASLEELIPISERAIAADGTFPLKLIKPGWGSSGYYSEAVLKRDIPTVFPKGTKMYANHPTESEERDRPERDIRDIAAVLETDPVWRDDPTHGPGMYAKAKLIDTWRPQIEAIGAHIGASIRALGKAATGEAEGRTGTVIERLIKGRSVDFVTEAGAGGKIISLAESARERHEEGDMADDTKLQEALRELSEEKQKRARAETALIVLESRGRAATKLKDVKIPDAMKDRIVETVAANPPIKDGKLDESVFDTKIAEAAKAEAAYLAKLTGAGTIVGMGAGAAGGRDFAKELGEAFREMGFDEKESAALAVGRGN